MKVIERESRVDIYPHLPENAEMEDAFGTAHISVVTHRHSEYRGQIQANYSIGLITRDQWAELNAAVEKAFEIAEALPKVEQPK